jgi:hypothetical protein
MHLWSGGHPISISLTDKFGGSDALATRAQAVEHGGSQRISLMPLVMPVRPNRPRTAAPDFAN